MTWTRISENSKQPKASRKTIATNHWAANSHQLHVKQETKSPPTTTDVTDLTEVD
jgi:hypothetical protein